VDDSRNKRGALRFASVALTVLLVLLIFAVGVWVGGHPRQTGLDQLPGGVRDRLVDEDRTAISTQVLAILKDSYYKPLAPEVVKRVENLSEDRVLRQYVATIRAIVRTNDWRRDPEGGRRRCRSFKIRSAEGPGLPEPKPQFENLV